MLVSFRKGLPCWREPSGLVPFTKPRAPAYMRALVCVGAGARASLLAHTFVFGGEVLRKAGGLALKILGSSFYFIFAVTV